MINTKIALIEVGITSQDNLQSVEYEKLRKYDMLANELGQMHKAKVKVIPYVLTWDGIVTEYTLFQKKTHNGFYSMRRCASFRISGLLV